jgi:hypothetical protein
VQVECLAVLETWADLLPHRRSHCSRLSRHGRISSSALSNVEVTTSRPSLLPTTCCWSLKGGFMLIPYHYLLSIIPCPMLLLLLDSFHLKFIYYGVLIAILSHTISSGRVWCVRMLSLLLFWRHR